MFHANTYYKGGQIDFEEFVCCMAQHKFYKNILENQYTVNNHILAYLGGKRNELF